MQACRIYLLLYYVLSFVSIDGQKIAKRLSVNITKETRTAKKLLQEYNTAASTVNDAHIPICLEEALLPDSDFWQTVHVAMPGSSALSWSTKKDITSQGAPGKKNTDPRPPSGWVV